MKYLLMKSFILFLFSFNAFAQVYDVRLIRNLFTYNRYNLPSLVDSNREFYYTFNYQDPYQSINHVSTYLGRVLFEIDYDIGELGLRNIGPEFYSKKAKKFLIVAGDSNVFGVGVNNNETLPVVLAGIKSEYHPYNFGIRGGAPHSTLGMMEFFPWEKLIKEKEGTFIYNYYDFLIDRVIGSLGYIAWNNGNSPNYQLNSNGEAEYSGSFKDRFITKIYKFIIDNKWLHELIPNLPRYREHHLDIVTAVFYKMQQEFLKKFPNGKFLVAINYCMSEMVPGRLHKLEQEFNKKNIAYIKLPYKAFVGSTRLPDGHLNALGHKTEAELISSSL